MKVELKYVPVSLVDFNEGQLEGVPANPRTREDSRQAKLAESIEELPEMSEARPPLVFPYNGRYIVIGGNRRLEAFHALKREQIPVVTLPADTSTEHLRRIVLIDNESTGETDWDAVMKNWNDEELSAWGIDVPIADVEMPKTETERLSELKFTGVYYEPKNIPNITLEECFDTSKFDKKVEFIESLPLSAKQKKTLKQFAYRFIKIDFEAVANYYAFHATEVEKQAIERRRLVLVDGGVNGFIEDELLRVVDFLTDDEQ